MVLWAIILCVSFQRAWVFPGPPTLPPRLHMCLQGLFSRLYFSTVVRFFCLLEKGCKTQGKIKGGAEGQRLRSLDLAINLPMTHSRQGDQPSSLGMWLSVRRTSSRPRL